MSDSHYALIMSPVQPAILPNETLFQFVERFASALQDREDQIGGYTGDGLTGAQAAELVAKLRPVYEGLETSTTAAIAWAAFRASVEAETAWILPENDAIGQQLIWAMGVVRDSRKEPIQGLISETNVNEYVSLHFIRQAAKTPRKVTWQPHHVAACASETPLLVGRRTAPKLSKTSGLEFSSAFSLLPRS